MNVRSLIGLALAAACVVLGNFADAADNKKKKNKKGHVPEGYTVDHDGSGLRTNVIMYFHDTTGAAWPVYFHGSTDNPSSFVFSSQNPQFGFTARPQTLSLSKGDQSRRIFGELFRLETETYEKRGETKTRKIMTWPEIVVTCSAAGAVSEEQYTEIRKGKERTKTRSVIPTKVVFTINGRELILSGSTTYRSSARDGKVGAVNLTTTGEFTAEEIGLEVFPESIISYTVATSLYPAKKGKKKRKKK